MLNFIRLAYPWLLNPRYMFKNEWKISVLYSSAKLDEFALFHHRKDVIGHYSYVEYYDTFSMVTDMSDEVWTEFFNDFTSNYKAIGDFDSHIPGVDHD